VLILEVIVVLLLGTGLFVFLKRGSGPTRSITHLLYDTEHPTRDRS
jgi:hypothetical protein